MDPFKSFTRSKEEVLEFWAAEALALSTLGSSIQNATLLQPYER